MQLSYCHLNDINTTDLFTAWRNYWKDIISTAYKFTYILLIYWCSDWKEVESLSDTWGVSGTCWSQVTGVSAQHIIRGFTAVTVSGRLRRTAICRKFLAQRTAHQGISDKHKYLNKYGTAHCSTWPAPHCCVNSSTANQQHARSRSFGPQETKRVLLRGDGLSVANSDY